MTLPLSNTTLEIAFNNLLLREASPIEREFLHTHPELYTYAFLCFVRGCDWANERYLEEVNKMLAGDLHEKCQTDTELN